VLSCRPVERETQLGYAALGDLLGVVPDPVVAELPAPQRRAIDVALLRAEPGAEGSLRRAVAVATLGVLRLLARDAPTIVAIDDVQWRSRLCGREAHADRGARRGADRGRPDVTAPPRTYGRRMYPHVTQFETRDVELRNRARLDAERRAGRASPSERCARRASSVASPGSRGNAASNDLTRQPLGRPFGERTPRAN
jgi:hypothetical protein